VKPERTTSSSRRAPSMVVITAGAGQAAGGFGDLVQHGVDVEARADAQDGRGERGDPFAQRLDLLHRLAAAAQWVLLPVPVRIPGRIRRSTVRANVLGRRLWKRYPNSRFRYI